MAVFRMYSDKDGRTRFEDIPLTFEPSGTGRITQLLPAAGPPTLRITTGTTQNHHTTKSPWYWVLLEGTINVIGEGSERRSLKPGDILLAEDLHGQGHIVRMNGCKRWVALYIPVAEGKS